MMNDDKNASTCLARPLTRRLRHTIRKFCLAMLARAYKTKVCSTKSLFRAKEILIVDIAVDNEFLHQPDIT